MVAQRGNAHRHRRGRIGGTEAERKRFEFAHQHPVLDQIEDVDQAAGQQRHVVVQVGVMLFLARDQIDDQGRQAPMAQDAGQHVLARVEYGGRIGEYDEAR